MLIAIAVYDDNFITNPTALKRIIAASENSSFTFFNKSPLTDLDSTVTVNKDMLLDYVTIPIKTESDEYHYLRWIKSENILMAFSSKRQLDKSEIAPFI